MHRAAIAVVVAALLASACTWPQQILWSLIPDGTFTTLLSNLRGLSTPTQERLAALEAERDWPGILKLADDSLAKDQHEAQWWFVRGYALGRQDRWREAAESFAAAVRIDPESLDSWHMLAQAQRFSDQRARAASTLERSLDVARDIPMTYFLLGEVQREQTRFPAARTAYREALRLAPEFVAALYGLGLVEAADGRGEAREAIAVRLQAHDPALAERLRAVR
jgi:cytochrome c-type biogenesis protein CcmH/NrfG